MGKLRAILILAFFVGIVCTHAQQATATLTPTQTGAGGVPYRIAAFGINQFGGFANTTSVGWRLSYANLPPQANVVTTVTVTYNPRQGNTWVQNFSHHGRTGTVQSPAAATVNSANSPPFAINFGRSPSGTPVTPPPGLVCGTYTLSVTFTVNGTAGNAPQPETGTVQFGGTQQPQNQNQQQAQNQSQNQNQSGGQQNQNQFPGPQQQNVGTGTRVSGRPSLIIRKTIHRRSGRAGKGNNLIYPTHAQRRNYMNYVNSGSMNRRQALRNYRNR